MQLRDAGCQSASRNCDIARRNSCRRNCRRRCATPARYSSLAYLDELPLDGLKIDRSFVASMGQHGQKRAIVQAIIAIAKSLRLSITAEGIETADQYSLLRAQGCDLGQGFYVAQPQPIDELIRAMQPLERAA
ncbi:MAG: EAL domain-containing protein [Chloroflexi bacterium]|nr:EAL domain-containing protein [Chloroflexota bacterium]